MNTSSEALILRSRGNTIAKFVTAKRYIRQIVIFSFLVLHCSLAEVVAQTVECTSAPSGLISWWRAEGDATDTVSGNVGMDVGGLSFPAGETGLGFGYTGPDQFVLVPASSSLDVGAGNGLTVEAWIDPEDVASGRPIVEWNNGASLGAHFWICLGDATPGLFGANLIDVNGGTHVITSAGGALAANIFQHVAVTYDRDSGLARLYVDGTIVKETDLGIFTPQTSYDFYIGYRPPSGQGTGTFLGIVDEVSLYDHALDPTEIQAVFNAGTAGKCVPESAPYIFKSPTNRVVVAGDATTFHVLANGAPPLTYQWLFNGTNLASTLDPSLTLTDIQVNQAGDYSVLITNDYGSVTSSIATLTVNPVTFCAAPPSGLIAWWRGEGAASDSVGENVGLLAGNSTYGPGKVGSAFVLDGDGDGVLLGDPQLFHLQNFTIETWIKRSSDTQVSAAPDSAILFGYGTGGFAFGVDTNSHLFLTKVGSSRVTVNAGPSDTNWHHVAVTKSGSAVTFYLDGTAYTSAPYNPGFTFSTNAAIGCSGDGLTNTFLGSIDETSIFARALSAAEVQAIYAARSLGKCVTPVPPFIVTQPVGQNVAAGTSPSFTVVAGGSVPLGYQWRLDGNNLSGATNVSLTLTNVLFEQAGTYSVIVTNLAGPTLSSNAVLTVVPPVAAVRVPGVTATAGDVISVPVEMVANGNENTLAFSLNFSTSRLTYNGIVLGSGAAGAALLVNTSQINSGRLGVAVIFPGSATFNSGTQQVVRVNFNSAVLVGGSPVATPISFGDVPIPRQLSDAQYVSWPATYASGTVTMNPTAYESDSAPRPNGNQSVVNSDWTQAGLFAAGIDIPASGSEFQRADSAPRNTRGDGRIRVTDWVQAGRYATGLDPITISGGPTSQVVSASVLLGGPRELRIGAASPASGTSMTVPVILKSQGNENALGLSFTFDPAKLVYSSASLGSGASGATLNLNTTQIASGNLGLVLALPPGSSFVAGTQEVLRLNFIPMNAYGFNAVGFGDQPVPRSVSDAGAGELASDYVAGSIGGNDLPSLNITLAGTNVLVAWPVWASAFHLQSANDSPIENWTDVVAPVETNGENLNLMLPVSGIRLFRLAYP